MDITEWIGFFISVFAVLFLMIKSGRENKRRRANPEEYDRKANEREKQLKKLLNIPEDDKDHIEGEEVEEEDFDEIDEPKPEPKASPVILHTLKAIMPPMPTPVLLSRKSPARRATPTYHPSILRWPSQGKNLTRAVSLKDMIVIREIIGPPKSDFM